MEAFYIEDIKIETNGDCTVDSSSLYSENTLKELIKKDCTGKTLCRLNESLRYLDQFICEPNVRPVDELKLDYHCKLFEFSSDKVFNMSRKVDHQSTAASDTVFLAMKSAPKWSSRSCSVTSQAPATLRLLRVDFGDLRDQQPDCRRLLEITHANSTTSYKWNSISTSSAVFNDTSFEINVMMSTGLVWIEVNSTKSVTITCGKGRADMTCTGDDDRAVSDSSQFDVVFTIIILLNVTFMILLIAVVSCVYCVCRRCKRNKRKRINNYEVPAMLQEDIHPYSVPNGPSEVTHYSHITDQLEVSHGDDGYLERAVVFPRQEQTVAYEEINL